ncbi:MAG: hypothetical protein HY036_05745 [Nitrospirae bacterium]|nr:hypothetical protein [Nitrospirota bacterium]MBI3352063.1 hypothetical protein [Nitrospirota bacterium]
MWGLHFKKTTGIWLIGSIIPFYLFLSFSTVVCSFHKHLENGFAHGSPHASSKMPHQHHSSDTNKDFCKYAQCFSADFSTTSALQDIPLDVDEKVFLSLPSIPFKASANEIFLRGPPSLVHL